VNIVKDVKGGKRKVEEIRCPICSKTITNMTEKARNSHVSACLESGISDEKEDVVNTNGLQNPFEQKPIRKPNTNLLLQPPESKERDNPFVITCPFDSCNKLYEARHLPCHIFLTHSTEEHSYSCPICILTYEGTEPLPTSNLLEHFINQHKDIPLEYKPPEEVTINVGALKLDTSYYTEHIIETVMNKECDICFEEFKIGDICARMACFCLYHKHCIEKWFTKQKHCPTHYGSTTR